MSIAFMLSCAIAPGVASIDVELAHNVFPTGVSNETAYRAWLTEQHAAFSSQPDSDRPRQANWILAYACEPIVSRTLLGMAEPAEYHELIALIDDALARLPDDPAEENVELVLHFGRAMRAVADARRGATNAEELDRVAGDLALWLDDERTGVRHAAQLWQSLVFRERGLGDRVLATLPAATAPLRDDPAAYYSRLLRCGIHLDSDEHTLAFALLMKIEERTATWFSTTAQADAAENAALWIRWRQMMAFRPPLGPLAQEAYGGLSERAGRSLEDLPPPRELLRLHPAIPTVLLPQAPAEPPRGDGPFEHD